MSQQQQQQQSQQLHNNINSTSQQGRQQRNNGKGKYLTRSHAMHECTSPPQTPTPRAGNISQSTVTATVVSATAVATASAITVNQINDPTKVENTNKMSSVSPITVNTTTAAANAATNITTNANNAQQQQQQSSSSSTTTPNMFAPNGNLNVSQLDLEFPKLTPPKSKSPRNNSNVTNNNNHTQHGVGTVNSNSDHSSSTSSINNNENAGDGNRECDVTGLAACNNSQAQTLASDSSTKSNHAVDIAKGNTTNNMVSCTILLNDVEKKCDLLLQGNQQNCIDENFSDKDKCNNADESSNANVEFVYKKNRNSTVTKGTGGGGGGGGGGGSKSRQKQNYAYEKSNNNNNNIGTDTNQSNNTSNGCPTTVVVENSADHFTDQSGVDLLQFFKITLNKNAKDRYMLLRIEKELAALTQDHSRDIIKFPTMSSYNRMLIHRVAAWFGMEHNVDSAGQCVIVNTTKATRLPEIRFKTLLTDTFSDETPSRKSILKRDAHSFEEYRQGLLACPDHRGNLLDRKARSFEEREQEYEKTKRRIFKEMNSESIEQFWNNWHSGEGFNQNHTQHKNSNNNNNNNSSGGGGGGKSHANNTGGNSSGSNADNTKCGADDDQHQQHQTMNEMRTDGRPSVEKSHSFGGYGPQTQTRIVRGDSVTSTKSANLNKQDCNQQTWRLSPSSSGYKSQSQSQSLRSNSVTPSPSYGSENHTPEPPSPIPSVSSGIVWAVTDMASVPKGSVLIDPQTLKPIVNQDGSIYHFDPSNLPPCTKLQIPNISPTQTPSPTLSANNDTIIGTPNVPPPPFRKKNHKLTNISTATATATTTTTAIADDPIVQQRTSDKCDRENISNSVANAAATAAVDKKSNASKPEIAVSTELKVTVAEPTPPPPSSTTKKNISMNSLLSPLNQITHQEIQDNNLDRKADVENCSEPIVQLSAKSQSTSPNNPCDSEQFQPKPSNPTTPSNIDDNLNQSSIDSKVTVPATVAASATVTVANNQATTEKPSNVTNPTNPSGGYATSKKEEIKIVPAVVPVLGYTAAPPNIYQPPMESGVQFVTGAQQAQPTSFSTTYQQGLDGSIYAVQQPMIYGYPTVQENEYSSGIFVPMYDQSGGQVPVSTQQTDQNTTTSDYRRNCGVPLAFFEPQSTAMAVVPVAYPTTSTATPYAAAAAAAAAAAPAHNIYQGQIVYTSDQYNPANATSNQVPQYINYPVGYTYPAYNGSIPYWGQAMTYYVPQTAMQAQTTAIANPTTNANVNNNNDSNISSSSGSSISNKQPPPPQHSIQSPHNIPSHPNSVVKTSHYASQQQQQQQQHSINETPKSITTPTAASQPNVFQYPPTVPSTSSTSIAKAATPTTTTTTINATTNSSSSSSSVATGAAMTPVQSLPNTSASVTSSSSSSASMQTTVGHENTKLMPHITSSHPSHRTKNHQALLSTPSENYKANNNSNINVNTDEPDSKDYSNHSSSNYERKKNLQNSNRKPYMGSGGNIGGGGGGYRGGNPNVGLNSHHGNAVSMNNNAPVGQSNITSAPQQPPPNQSMRKGPLIHHPMSESSGNSHMYSSGAGHHHENTPPPTYNQRVNSTQNSSSTSQMDHSEKRPISHNKPLIATLPTLSNVHNHFDRTRAPRPKPLDLRRNASNRNTPSTNSTESNNSPNSIVSSDQQHHPQNHHQQQQQPQPQIQTSSSYVSGTVNSSAMNQTGIQQNIGPRVVRAPTPKGVRMYHGDMGNSNSDSLASQSPALCGEPFAYNPHSGMYIKFGKTYITHSMAFPNKAQQNDIRQSLPPLTGIYPTMNMMLTGYPTRPHAVGPRPSHVNPNFNKNNRTPR